MYLDSSDLQRLLAQSDSRGDSWLGLGLLAGYLIVALYRQEAVTSWVIFRIGTVCFAIAMVLPAFVSGVTLPIARFGLSANFEGLLAQGAIGCIAPASLAASLLCLLASVAPRRSTLAAQATPLAPQKHPLDD
jgi:hypothetical protein